MNIEFHVPEGQVREQLIDVVKQKLMDMYHSQGISRAQVYFKEQTGKGEKKVCEIELSLYGDIIFVHRKARKFEQAANEVLKELARMTGALAMKLKLNEPPDEIMSTVKI